MFLLLSILYFQLIFSRIFYNIFLQKSRSFPLITIANLGWVSILSEHRLISSDFRPSIFPQLHQPFFLETIDGGAIIWTIVVMDRQRFKYSFPIQIKNIATSLRKRTKRQKEKEKNSWKWRRQKSSYDQFAFGQRNANRASMTRKTIKFFKNFHLNAATNLFPCFSSTYFSECHISIKYCYKY